MKENIRKDPAATLITHDCLPVKFLLLDCPKDSNLDEYIHAINVQSGKTCSVVVRLCESNFYSKDLLFEKSNGEIRVIDDIKIADGYTPAAADVIFWRSIVQEQASRTLPNGEMATVAVHCVSGVGRAPVFVTLSLVDYGCDPYDAIEYIRKRRPGALNKRQIRFIMDKEFPKFKSKKSSSSLGKKLLKIFS